MILVAIVAELLEEYTVVLARVLEQLIHEAPFPRRMRFLILRSLPFISPPRLTGFKGRATKKAKAASQI
ncbi:uncharacterized protein LOC18436346 isoform X3 [Amborella trichopoda]|uniref:uncharacterized protein LOC18436346 isoform X3 n=1 Tax=Amborella trichopoda TaxID=13333 RepID=UPI0009C16B9A|nr:uncharacterized protein LOC18436346 isoform X3 [Amborella trichopoda]|eukprot:XP_020524170.1 uncharacterized protein LOC18436346 isoform X3 [Amborella trichopoda]